MAESKNQKLLVAVSSSPSSEYLVRKTFALAQSLSASWTALHVDDGRQLSPEDEARIEKRLAQAKSMGAEVAVVGGSDIAEGIVTEARKRLCDTIVIGRSGLGGRAKLSRRLLSERVASLSAQADVLVVKDGLGLRGQWPGRLLRCLFSGGPGQYIFLALAFAALLALGFPLSRLIGYRSVALVFLAAVICLSLVARPGPVAVFAVASAAALNFFLIPPYFTLSISLVEDAMLFGVYFLAAFVTSTLVASVRSNARQLRDKERRAALLSEALEALSSCLSSEAVALKAAQLAADHFGLGVLALAPQAGGPAKVMGQAGKPSPLGEDGQAAVAKILAPGPGDAGAEIAETATHIFVAANLGGKRLGALGIERRPDWSRGDTALLQALGHAMALAMERQLVEGSERQAAVALESERFSRILLDTVSHELRTPLTAITGLISAMTEPSMPNDESLRAAMLREALRASDRLNAVVDDLLSASRIGAGKLRPRWANAELSEIAAAAAEAAAAEILGRELVVRIEGQDTQVTVDLALISRLAANLLKNAGRHSTPGAPIELFLSQDGGMLRVEARDCGPGLPPGMEWGPFRKHAQGQGGGLGLGLSICQGIAQAHGGRLEIVENGPRRFRIAALIPAEGGEKP